MKILVKHILTLMFLTLVTLYHVKAQDNQKLRNKIELALISYFNTEGGEVFSSPRYKNKAYTFGFAIGINQNGKIDNVLFSNKSKYLDSLVSFKSIVKQLKADEKVFINKKNSVLVGIVLVRKSWDNTIDNFYDSNQRRMNPDLIDFDQYFYNIIPNIEKISRNRKIQILPAFSLVQGRAKP